jgi:hypothetical protein
MILLNIHLQNLKEKYKIKLGLSAATLYSSAVRAVRYKLRDAQAFHFHPAAFEQTNTFQLLHLYSTFKRASPLLHHAYSSAG